MPQQMNRKNDIARQGKRYADLCARSVCRENFRAQFAQMHLI